MKKNLLFSVITLLLVSCNDSIDVDNSISVSVGEQTISVVSSINEDVSVAQSSQSLNSQSNTSVTSVNKPSIENSTIASTSSYTSSNSPYEVPSNTPFSLNNWENFAFSDGSSSHFNEYWTYYYGTSINPYNGVRGDKYGVDMDYKTKGLVSPLFNAWEKVEVNIDLYYIARTSSKYKPVANEPQFKLVQYDMNGKQLSEEEIYIDSSKVNANYTKYTLKIDVYNNKMNYFDLKYNNSVAKSSTYYTYAISQISLKGWPYGQK